MYKDNRRWEAKQDKSVLLEHHLYEFLGTLLWGLNEQIDRRLVSTFYGLVMAVIMHRHRNHGLLLSELGGYLLGAERCWAGTKRISNLLHCEKWKAKLINRYPWQRGTERVADLQAEGELPLILRDESVLEKPESLKAERLFAVRSRKAQRLKHIKPGYFNPPGVRPIFVPGFNWLQILVIGRKGPPTLLPISAGGPPGESTKAPNERKMYVF